MAAFTGLDTLAALQFDISGTPTTIGLRKNWSLSIDQNTIDTTTAADSGWSTNVAGLKTASLECECLYNKDDPVQDKIRSAMFAATTVDAVMKLDGETFSSTGTISNYSVSANYDDVVSLSFSVSLEEVSFA